MLISSGWQLARLATGKSGQNGVIWHFRVKGVVEGQFNAIKRVFEPILTLGTVFNPLNHFSSMVTGFLWPKSDQVSGV